MLAQFKVEYGWVNEDRNEPNLVQSGIIGYDSLDQVMQELAPNPRFWKIKTLLLIPIGKFVTPSQAQDRNFWYPEVLDVDDRVDQTYLEALHTHD